MIYLLFVVYDQTDISLNILNIFPGGHLTTCLFKYYIFLCYKQALISKQIWDLRQRISTKHDFWITSNTYTGWRWTPIITGKWLKIIFDSFKKNMLKEITINYFRICVRKFASDMSPLLTICCSSFSFASFMLVL